MSETDNPVVLMQADVRLERDVLSLLDACDAQLGCVSAVVNNAGIVGAKARVDELSRSRIEDMLATNVVGTLLCCREAVRPGIIDTEIHASGGMAEEVAAAILWLLSEQASYTTGTLLDVSGGR